MEDLLLTVNLRNKYIYIVAWEAPEDPHFFPALAIMERSGIARNRLGYVIMERSNDKSMHILIENPITDPAYFQLLHRENEYDDNWTMIADWNRLKKISEFPMDMRFNFTHRFELPHSGQLWVTTHTECSVIWNVTDHIDASEHKLPTNNNEESNDSDCCPTHKGHTVDIMHKEHHSFNTDILC